MIRPFPAGNVAVSQILVHMACLIGCMQIGNVQIQMGGVAKKRRQSVPVWGLFPIRQILLYVYCTVLLVRGIHKRYTQKKLVRYSIYPRTWTSPAPVARPFEEGYHNSAVYSCRYWSV